MLVGLQRFLSGQDFAWFHPDDFTLIARRRSDLLHVTARAGEGVLGLTVSFSAAPPDAVQAVTDGIAWTLAQLQ